MKRKRISALVLAAGAGRRFGRDKCMARVSGVPVVLHSIRTLLSCPEIEEIVVVTSESNRRRVGELVRPLGNRIRCVSGGARRQDSVYNGLRSLTAESWLVLIHDAARPFITRALIRSLIRRASFTGAAVPALRVKSTIKSARGGVVTGTVPRDGLWEVQTPQAFKTSLIRRAYDRYGRENATDDAQVAERAGEKVAIVPGLPENMKITTPHDAKLAAWISIPRR